MLTEIRKKSQKLSKQAIIAAIAIFIASAVNAQDIIQKDNGDRIIANVLEVGVYEIKYKRFDNQSGPTYTVLRSEVLSIKYENGTIDVFKERQITTKKQSSYLERTPSGKYFKKDLIGLDFSIGGIRVDGTKNGKKMQIMRDEYGEYAYHDPMQQIGVRWLHYFLPFLGWDVIKLNTHNQFNKERIDFQILSGIRINTPVSETQRFGCYGSFKWGYGWRSKGDGFCYEIDFGLHFTPTFFVGYVYNFQKLGDLILRKNELKGEHFTNVYRQYHGARFGWNIGTEKEKIYKSYGLFIDLGLIGFAKTKKIVDDIVLETDPSTFADIGIRYLTLFSDYIGWDVVKVKTNIELKELNKDNGYAFLPQLMSGVRAFTPAFIGGNNIKGFAANRAGMGFFFKDIVYGNKEFGVGFCYEAELGVNLTKSLFLAVAYNWQTRKNLKTQINYFALRTGFLF